MKNSGTISAAPAGDAPPAVADLPSAAQLAQLARSELLDAQWYLARYRDVALLKMDPAEHYLRLGARIGRSPGPRFDGPRYLAENPDVAAAGSNPLLHYLAIGRSEGRLSYAIDRPPIADPVAWLQALADAKVEGKPQRMFASFDTGVEQDFVECLAKVAAGVSLPTVSVVMPAFNRERSVARAIESVRAQSHSAWELLVVDDGSTDRTIAIVESYASDPRIRLLRQQHRGVSAARNMGLEHASGDWVFYLDSDNRWTDGFLANMLRYLVTVGRECGYSSIAVEDDGEVVTGYRGEPFDWDACLHGNYVDLNAFGHTRALYQRLGGFDESLRRMVDWDLILRYTKQVAPAYAPFLGCLYRDSKLDQVRISVSQPIAYRSVVQTKNRLASPSAPELARHLSLPIAIKIPAPYDKRHAWGDFHYAESLKASLERLGHRVVIDFLGDWYGRPASAEQVVIVLRGLTAYEPRPGQVNILWNISHPDQVTYDEYAAFDCVYVASLSYPALLQPVLDAGAPGTPVQTLLQCTDTARFHPVANLQGDAAAGGVLFVGNSRNEYRRLVRWAVEAGASVRVHGGRWEQFLPAGLVAGGNIDNHELARYYQGADVVLNDHWDSMRDFGFVSNRIFDVLAAGGRLVSDPVPSIDLLFGDRVRQVDSAGELSQVLAAMAAEPDDGDERHDAARHVARLHSFDARAAAICNDVLGFLGLPRVHADAVTGSEVLASARRVRIGLLLQAGRRGPTSSGFIRLVAPLTTDGAQARIEIRILASVDDPALAGCDLCIVQRVAVDRVDDAQRLVDRLESNGTPLLVDNDDAFSLLDASHPEAAAYREKDAALRHLLARARQAMFSTDELRRAYGDVAPRAAVVANTLDPRLWRDYRKPRRALGAAGCVQLLYMGTATHDADFEMILPALDRLHADHPGRFRLTVVGALRQAPVRDWLQLLPVPAKAGDYPRFVRWLGAQGPFDVGLAPLVDGPFNACKSDIKFLDYSALGLLSLLSDVPAYASVASRPGLAVLVSNAGWHAALEDVVLGRVDMEGIAARAADYVWAERASHDSALLGCLQPWLADPGPVGEARPVTSARIAEAAAAHRTRPASHDVTASATIRPPHDTAGSGAAVGTTHVPMRTAGPTDPQLQPPGQKRP